MSASSPAGAADTTGWTRPAGFAWTYGALLIANLLAALDQTIVSTALPTVVGDLGNLSLMSWVIAGYSLAMTVAMPVYGKFGDAIGRRPLFLIALVLFVGASALCGLSQSVAQLVAFRSLQGLGGGGLMVLSQAIVAELVPPNRRAAYGAPMGAMFVLASLLGPLIGGLLTDHAHWRWVFWINLPIGIAALLAAFFALKLPRHANTIKPDIAGILTATVAVSALTLLSGWGGTTYAWLSPQIIGLGALVIIGSIAFVLVEQRATDPIIPMRLFENHTFALTTLLGVICALGLLATVAYIPTYLQMVYGFGATMSGYLMLPSILGTMVTSIGSGIISSRTGHYRPFVVVGLGLMSAGLFLLSTLSADQSVVLVCLYNALIGLGMGCVMQLLVIMAQNAVPLSEIGTATSSNNFFREIGATLGTAIVGGMFASRLGASLSAISLGDLSSEGLTPALVAGLADAQHAQVVEAYATALMPIFLYLLPVFIVATALGLLLRDRPEALSGHGQPALDPGT